MNTHETTEIRELTPCELDLASGGYWCEKVIDGIVTAGKAIYASVTGPGWWEQIQ
jgi:hypothetical protein